jgi:hypothetical protein
MRGVTGFDETIAPVPEEAAGSLVAKLSKKVRPLLDDNLHELLTDLALGLV